MPQFGRFVDSRDGHVYRTVLMPDGKWWFAEDLAFVPTTPYYISGTSFLYKLDEVPGHEALPKLIPSGCRIPNALEWRAFNSLIDSAGISIRSATGWNSDLPQSVDAYKFNAKPFGVYNGTSLLFQGTYAAWWLEEQYAAYIANDSSAIHYSSIESFTNYHALRFIVDSGNIPDPTECAPVTYSPPAGTYDTPQTVALSTETAGAAIYYTVDGSEPYTEAYQTGEVIDPTDGSVYPVVWIAGAWWMQRNLAWAGAGVDYAGDPANRPIYGRLYTWAQAMSWVPSGWQIPTATQYITLINACGGPSFAGKRLKAITALWSPNTGTDDYGFSALPAGYRRFDTLAYTLLGSSTLIWSSSVFNPNNPGTAYYLCINAGSDAIALPESGNSLGTRTNWMSIRAIVPDSDVFNRRQATLYTAPLTISESTTVKAIAVKAGLDDSAVTSALYTSGNTPDGPNLFGAPFQGFERGYSLEISRKISEIPTLGSAPVLLPYAPADKDEWIVDAELWVTAAQAAEIQARVPPKGAPLERAISVPPRSGANTFAGLAPFAPGIYADTYIDPVVLSLESLGQKAVAVDLYGFRIRFSLSCSSVSNPYSSNPATPPTATPPAWLNQKFRVHQIEDCSVEERVIAPTGKWSSSPNSIKAGRGLPLSITLDYLTQERADELVAFFRGIRSSAFTAPLDFPGATSTSFVARKLSLTRPGLHWEGTLEVYQA